MERSTLGIIDLNDDSTKNAKKIVEYAARKGFLMFEGHGFLTNEVDLLFDVSKGFFNLPKNQKNKFERINSIGGYTGIGNEILNGKGEKESKGDPKESFDFANFNLSTGVPEHDMPEYWENNIDIIKSTVLKLDKCLNKALTLFAVGLEILKETENTNEDNNIDSQWFTRKHGPDQESGTCLRLLHYPNPNTLSLSNKDINVAGIHSDYGTLTMLFQREGLSGLEILSPTTNNWEYVPFVDTSDKYKGVKEAPPLIVNIGDQLSFWTNGFFKSTLHRVRFPETLLCSGNDRYAIAFFAHPGNEVQLKPVPSKLIEAEECKDKGANNYKKRYGRYLTAGEHLQQRLENSYNWE